MKYNLIGELHVHFVKNESLERLNNHIKANHVNAYFSLRTAHLYGDEEMEVPRNPETGLQLFLRGGELGSAESYHQVECIHHYGMGVEKDKKKAKHFYELAAIGGDVGSRHNLGVFECQVGNMGKAIKHFNIAAGFGNTASLTNVKIFFMNGGHSSRDDCQQALLSYQQYVEEVRSDQRDEAAAFRDDHKYLYEE
jgi:TPR repeat protein